MYYDLAKTSKLPLNIIKGSPKQRADLSHNLFINFYKNVSESIHGDRISIDEMKDCFLKTVPAKIAIQFSSVGKQFSDKDFGYDGCIGYMVRGKNRKVVGFNVFLPLDNSRKNLELKHLNILFHEMKHVYDFITNPKTLVRGFWVPKKLQNFYDSKIYQKDAIKLDKLETRINNQIKRLPFYKRVDFLQDCRASLKSEINAFNAEMAYIPIATEHMDKMPLDKPFDDVEYFCIREKLAIVENLLKKELLSLRKENKQLYGT